MLGYLNEHLQLKRQALQAYQRSAFEIHYLCFITKEHNVTHVGFSTGLSQSAVLPQSG